MFREKYWIDNVDCIRESGAYCIHDKPTDMQAVFGADCILEYILRQHRWKDAGINKRVCQSEYIYIIPLRFSSFFTFHSPPALLRFLLLTSLLVYSFHALML